MAFYKFPIRPFDPVIEEDQATGAFRYYRDSFAGTGQDSHTRPPAQDQSFWQSLLNIMPITSGTLQRRWGYSQLHAGLGLGTSHAFSFQRDTDGLRTLITTGSFFPQAITEAGVVYNNNIFSVLNFTNPLRLITSRSYAYFYNGNRGDMQKWDGSPSGFAGVSNWGIDVNNVTSGSVFGPNLPTIAADMGDLSSPWTNPNNIKLADGSGASFVAVPGAGRSNILQTSAFNLLATGSVTGIQVDVGYKASSTIGLNLSLVKAGTSAVAGAPKQVNILNTGGSYLTQTFGGPTDLWGTYWNPGDVNGSTFTVDVKVAPNNGSTGQLSTVSVTAGGAYDHIPTVTVVGGGGTGATVIVSRYTVQKIGNPQSPQYIYTVTGLTITSPGSGYGTTPSIVFSTLHGDGATATCTISGVSPSITVSLDWIRVTVTTVPGAGINILGTSAGLVNLTVGRIYYEAFKNPTTGHYSDLSAASASTGPVIDKFIALSTSVNNDPQALTKVILATSDGGDPSILYQVAEIPNGQINFNDNIPETQLVLNQQLLFTDSFGNDFGLAGNVPPPTGNLGIKHKGRLWLAQGQNLFFSKAVAELTLPNGFIAGKYEESWPSDNFFDISEGAETISGLLSDGSTLYIGTQSHVRRLFGDDPTTFQEPEIVHAQVGVLNQDVWQIIYLEGSPSGAIWMTPDFRVVGSDFNTYTDIGWPVQDILNNLQPNAVSLAHAMFVADGEFDLYILAVPVNSTTACDYHLVYDIKNKLWFVWQPTIGSQGMLYNISASGTPQWLFLAGPSGGFNFLYQYQPQVLSDNGTIFPASAQTSWMHFGVPTKRKLLDDLEVIGDPAMTITIEGASAQGDFSTPNPVVTNTTLSTSPFGQQKVYLAGTKCNDRYYRMTFTSVNSYLDFLDAYNLRIIPFNAL